MSEKEAAPEYAPWTQRKGEPPKAYSRFAYYRDLGSERSLEKVRTRFKYKNLRFIKEWSSKYEWVDRVRAYDAYLDRLFLDERTREALKVREQHVVAAQAVRSKLLERIEAIKVNDLDIGSVILNLHRILRVERELYGFGSDSPSIVVNNNNQATATADTGSAPKPHRKLPTEKELAELDAGSLYEVFRSMDD